MGMRALSPALPLLAGLAGLAGCSANVSASADAVDAESSPAAAVIVVERTTGDSPRGDAVARFVRGRSGPLDEEAMRWLGLDLELPAAGACARTAPEVPSMPAGGLRLLDVGRVTLTAEPLVAGSDVQTMELVRRRVPDVVDVVSGVVYTASSLDLPSHGSFEVSVVGDPELAALRAQAEFEGEPSDVRLDGQDASNGAVFVSTDAPVDLAWDASSARADADLVYVDVSVPEAAARKAFVTRCTLADTGHASLPASAFGDADGSLSVHRMHRSTFRAPGVERGELRLDFAREIVFAVRARR
jgi:hypothetical protein